jgi:hypothetical protein
MDLYAHGPAEQYVHVGLAVFLPFIFLVGVPECSGERDKGGMNKEY